MTHTPTIPSPPQLDAMRRGALKLIVTSAGLKDVNRYPGKLEGLGAVSKMPLGYKGICKSDLYIKPKRDYAKRSGAYHWFLGERSNPSELNPIPVICPLGRVGGEIWVKEKWSPKDSSHGQCVGYHVDRMYRCGKPMPKDYDELRGKGAWKSARSMPRWASRFTLRLLSVEVRKVNTITAAEALAAGVECRDVGDETWFYLGKHRAGSARGAFQADYESKGGSFDSDFAWFARVESINTTQPQPASAAGEGGER